MVKTKDIPVDTESETAPTLRSRLKAFVYKKIEGSDELSFTEQVVALNEEQAEKISELTDVAKRAHAGREDALRQMMRERQRLESLEQACEEKVVADMNRSLEQAALIIESQMIPEPGFESEPLDRWELMLNQNLSEIAKLVREQMTTRNFETPLWDDLHS